MAARYTSGPVASGLRVEQIVHGLATFSRCPFEPFRTRAPMLHFVLPRLLMAHDAHCKEHGAQPNVMDATNHT